MGFQQHLQHSPVDCSQTTTTARCIAEETNTSSLYIHVDMHTTTHTPMGVVVARFDYIVCPKTYV